jgi:branched-chain amino acid transport system substrate-binding protein
VPREARSGPHSRVDEHQGDYVTRHRWLVPTTLLVSFGIVAAACGGDNKSGSAGTTAAAAATTAATTAASAAPATTAGGATTTAAEGPVIAPAGTGKYGQDPNNKNLYVGSNGFQLDVSKCPSDWNNNQGITSSEIDAFASYPTSGPLAGFALLYDGMRAYYDYVAQNGGIDGRKIVLTGKDDQYAPAATKTNSDEALAANKYAIFDAVLGTPNNLGIWDDTNRECMPQLLNATGAPQWGDVEGHPWTSGASALNYFSEAGLWVEWLKKKYPNGVKIASITFNNDFGNTYVHGINHYIQGTKIQLVGNFPHDPTAPNIDNEYTSAAGTGADVLLLQTTGTYCTQAMADVEKGSWHPVVILSATCQSKNQFFQPLIQQGLTGKDTYTVLYYKDPLDPALASDPFIVAYNDIMKKAGLDPNKTTYFTGLAFAWYTVAILKEAASYRGGLNRANIALASHELQVPSPIVIPGIASKVDGNKDAYMVEGGQMVKYTVTDPKQLGTWVPDGPVIDTDGQLGTYATVKAAGG